MDPDDQVQVLPSPSLDVYSFSIIMWELFFAQAPYTNSNGLCENKTTCRNMTPLSILSKVSRGERPVVPFNTRTELESWLEKYVPEYVSPKTSFTLVYVVDDYVSLMKECWNQDATLRPSFQDISHRLSYMQEQLNT